LSPIFTKSFVGWDFAPDPTVGVYSAPADPLRVFRGPASKGRGGERKRREEAEIKGREEGRGG